MSYIKITHIHYHVLSYPHNLPKRIKIKFYKLNLLRLKEKDFNLIYRITLIPSIYLGNQNAVMTVKKV